MATLSYMWTVLHEKVSDRRLGRDLAFRCMFGLCAQPIPAAVYVGW